MDLHQFYPTPLGHAAMMAKALNCSGRHTVLDPSAGTGVLLDAVKRLQPYSRVNAIELDLGRRYTLQGKGYRVLGSDWLTYNEPIKFDRIIMNPPFRNAEDHILKAWDYLEDGGILCSLIDSNALSGDLTKKEQLIVNLIRAHGKTEYLGQIFAEAERPAKVLITMIVLKKPKTESQSFDFLHTEDIQPDDFTPQALSKRDVVKDLVDRYNAAVAALQAKHKAQQMLDVYLDGVSSALMSDPTRMLLSFSEELDLLKSRFWNTVFTKAKLAERTTSKFKEDFHRHQKQQQNIAFTEANIKEILSLLYTNSDQIMLEGLVQCWEKCVSYGIGNKVHTEGWKSNKSYKVQKRVILPYGVTYGNFVSDSLRTLLDDLDVCLAYISGKPKPESRKLIGEYNLNYYPAFEYDTEWFYIRFFQKGSVHLIWKDLQLLAEFNRIAAHGKKELGNGI